MQHAPYETHMVDTAQTAETFPSHLTNLTPQIFEGICTYVDQLVDRAAAGESLAPFQTDLNALFCAAFPQNPLPDHFQEVMSDVSDFYRSVAQQSYPPGFSVSPFWERKQSGLAAVALSLTDPRHVILLAQIGRLSGFDHRIIGDSEAIYNIVSDKLAAIQVDFGIYPPQHLRLEESEYSLGSSIAKFGGKSYSTIFLTHMQHYLRTKSLIPGEQNSSILEIGGGYGGLARIFKHELSKAKYFIVDLPGSTVFSYVYLRMNFPQLNIHFATSPNQLSSDTLNWADIIVAPVNTSSCLAGCNFDLAINTGSMQEMNQDAVEYFMEYIERTTHCKYLYSFNYFLSVKECFTETSGMQSEAQVNLICPNLDQQWDSIYTRLNTPGLTYDCAARNWLEIVVRRMSADEDHVKRAESHYASSLTFPLMSHDWLHHALMAAFGDPSEEHVQNLLNGIELFFFAELDTPNYMFHPDAANHRTRYYFPAWPRLPIYTKPNKVNAALRRAMFEALGEVRYFRSLAQSRLKTPDLLEHPTH